LGPHILLSNTFSKTSACVLSLMCKINFDFDHLKMWAKHSVVKLGLGDIYTTFRTYHITFRCFLVTRPI
jgi:hypothetical protein